MTQATSAASLVILEEIPDEKKSILKEKFETIVVEIQNDSRSTSSIIAPVKAQAITAAPITISHGTYSVHTEAYLSVPDFYDSAYAKKQPWQESQANFGASLGAHGHFRSLFNPNGNYQNFYEVFAMSKARSFYETNAIPTFYSDLGNCTETTFVPPGGSKQYDSYRPFAIESRSYTRSYFYGSTR